MHDSTTRRRTRSLLIPVLAALFAGLLSGSSAYAQCTAPVEFDWITIPALGGANPGDSSELNPDTGQPIGSVGETYRIATREVTNAQYLAFLNAQAIPTDPNGLYSPFMSRKAQGIRLNIDCTSGCPRYEYTNNRYSVIADRPVGNVSYYSALRFANWVHNGCPTSPTLNANNVNTTIICEASHRAPIIRPGGSALCSLSC